MISVEDATQLVLSLAGLTDTETVPLARAAGRYMRNAAVALRDQPPFDASAMDGYALAQDAPEGEILAVIGEAGAGRAFEGALGAGKALRIFTGAPLPTGAARVVLQEDVVRSGDRITLTRAATGPTHIRPQGGDFRIGSSLAPRLLAPYDLALLAAMNVPEVIVARRPDVALIATGDELVMPGEAPRPDQIIGSNSFALKAMIEAAGGTARMLPIARDTEADLRAVLELGSDADVVVTIGGASVGDHDLVGRIAARMGMDLAFHKIAMRPGKPLMAGRIFGKPMLGLPGNPVSAIVCAHLFLLPLIRASLGLSDPLPRVRHATLGADVAATGPRAHYMRARLDDDGAVPRITPFRDQDSSLLGVLADAHALLIRPLGDGPRSAGDRVSYLPL